MSAATALRWVKKSSTWTSRALVWSVVTVVLACALVVLSLRYWILPNIEHYREDIAAAVSRAAKVRITIGKISADWDGIRPQLKLEDVAVFDKAGRRALELSRVESTLSWRSLAMLQLHFHALDIYQPVLDVRRDANGVFSVAGIEQMDDSRGGGFSDWLLQQADVEVHDAVVSWSDELRRAPTLQFEQRQPADRQSRQPPSLRRCARCRRRSSPRRSMCAVTCAATRSSCCPTGPAGFFCSSITRTCRRGNPGSTFRSRSRAARAPCARGSRSAITSSSRRLPMCVSAMSARG